MTHREAVALIDTPYLRNLTTPTRWADLGCGSGTFTLALADFLAPGSMIEAIDLQPAIAPQTTPRGVTIYPRAADFTGLEFALPDSDPAPAPGTPPHAPQLHSPAPASPAPLPDRLWPGTQPLVYHGIVMANSLHYVRDQPAFLKKLKTNALLLIEYDIDVPVARWVPYPLSFAAATRMLQSAGWPHVQKLSTHPSAFGRSDLYAALALGPSPAPAPPKE